jgi:hypothetical protein
MHDTFLQAASEEEAAHIHKAIRYAANGWFGKAITQGGLIDDLEIGTGVGCYIKGGFLRDAVGGIVGGDIDLRCVGVALSWGV